MAANPIVLSPLVHLLSLPIVLGGANSPDILSKFKNPERNIFTFKFRDGLSPIQLLGVLYSGHERPYQMHESIFVQIADKILRNEWYSQEGKLVLYAESKETPMWITQLNSPNIFCILPTQSVYDNLQKINSLFHSMLVRWIGNDRYIGLTVSGPKIFSRAEWAELLLICIKTDVAALKPTHSYVCSIIEQFIEYGTLGSWILLNFPCFGKPHQVKFQITPP